MEQNKNNQSISFSIPTPQSPPAEKPSLLVKLLFLSAAAFWISALYRTFTDPSYERQKIGMLWITAFFCMVFGGSALIDFVQRSRGAQKVVRGMGGLFIVGLFGLFLVWFLGELATAPGWAIALFILWRMNR